MEPEGENYKQDNVDESKVRYYSIESNMHSFVRFVNRTLRQVDVVWLNYEGARVRYVTLEPEQFLDVNTYVGHPWIFRDSQSGDRMVVQLREVYEPVGWTRNDGWPPQRKLVNITIPVYSLRERCLQIIRSLVPRESIDHLEIPRTLKSELKHFDGSDEDMTDYESPEEE